MGCFKKNYVILAIAIVAGSMLFPFPVVPDKYHIDKVAHLSIFTFLSFVVFKAVNRSGVNKRIDGSFFVFLALFAFATVFESLQIFIPRRGFSWYDLMTNWVGLLVGFVLARIRPVSIVKNVFRVNRGEK